jgi:hypothetical protein
MNMVDLSSNRLSGNIPQDLAKLLSLESLNLLGKLLFTPLKLATIFNSTLKVLIFSIDPPKFQFLSIQALLIVFFPKCPQQ